MERIVSAKSQKKDGWDTSLIVAVQNETRTYIPGEIEDTRRLEELSILVYAGF